MSMTVQAVNEHNFANGPGNWFGERVFFDASLIIKQRDMWLEIRIGDFLQSLPRQFSN